MKPPPLCVCDFAERFDNRIEVIVLQHPQEQDKLLGTARLALRHLERGALKIGLSWSSLSKAIGREAASRRWAVLYLGPAGMPLPPGEDIALFEGGGGPVDDQAAARSAIEGIIVLDGSWSQAKTLWWRNPWLLKTRRAVIVPKHASLYGKLRREPRREGLSTLEAIAFLLSRLEERPEIERAMLSSFRRMLQRHRDELKAGQAAKALS